MARSKDRDVTHRYVAAALERYRLVSGAGGIGTRQALFGQLASTKSAAADQARSENRDIVDAFAPDQAVVPVIMPEILVALGTAHSTLPHHTRRPALPE
jgi:hypothetical protein